MSIVRFFTYFVIAMLILFLSILLGEQAPWYFAWVLGTVMAILISVCGAVLFEGQEEERRGDAGTR